MTAATASIKALGIDRLNIEDKIALVEAIWASVCADKTNFKLTDAQRTELGRRVADADAFPDDGDAWEEIKATMDARWAR